MSREQVVELSPNDRTAFSLASLSMDTITPKQGLKYTDGKQNQMEQVCFQAVWSDLLEFWLLICGFIHSELK